MAKLRDYLELARASNLPTVWSNVLMGVVIGGVAIWGAGWLESLDGQRRSPWWELGAVLRLAWPALVGISLFYVAGMVLNDAVDADRDAEGDPNRPIPSGRIKRSHAYAAAILLFAGGLFVLALWGYGASFKIAVTLVACIVAYDVLHHRVAASRLLMGLCRGLAIACAAAWFAPHIWRVAAWSLPVFGVAALVMIYTWAISALAARESIHGDTRRKLVMGMIAAMPLLDAAILLVVRQWPVAIVCALCTPLTALAHRRVAGT